jgi:hypothetical protein
LLADLSFVAVAGSQGTGDGQFSSPEGVCSDGSFLYVADTGNGRIVKMTLAGMTYLSSFGHTNDILYRVRISESGGEHQGDPIAEGAYVFSSGNNFPGWASGPYVAFQNQAVTNPWHLSVCYGAEIGGYANSVGALYSYTGPNGPWTIYQGYGAAGWTGARNIFSQGSVGVHVWCSVGDMSPIKALHLDAPKGLVSDGTYLYVSDYNHGGVIAIKLSDLTYYSRFGVASGGLSTYPSGCAQSPAICIYYGSIFIPSQYAGIFSMLIKLASPALTTVSNFAPGRNTPPGYLVDPNGIWGLKGSLYTTELGNNRIQRFSITDYAYISHLGGTGAGSGINQFNAPKGITGNLWTP